MLRHSPMTAWCMLVLLGTFPVSVGHAFGEERGDVEHAVVLEIGGAGEADIKSGAFNFGVTLAVETTVIEQWLEVEVGLTTLATARHKELSGDLLFKKPFRLSPRAEFFIGFGPEVVRTFSGGERKTAVGIEGVLDFLFWQTKRFGWYVEPSYSYLVSKGGEHALGVTAGLLIGW